MRHSSNHQILKDLFSEISGGGEATVSLLPQSGSNRLYYRLSDGSSTYIGTFTPDAREGECFIRLANGFSGAGRRVPKVLAHTSDYRHYIQEDLGDISLFSLLGNPDAPVYIKESLRQLVALQKTPKEIWVGACMAAPFSQRQAMWDLNYFKYEYLKPKETIYDEDLLEDDFERLSKRLTSIPEEFQGFMMRDCQSRNVIVTDKGPVFIDFQGGRLGPALYDAVSMLWQARAGFSSEFRDEMLDFYCDCFCGGDRGKREEMISYLGDMVLFRTLQVLGAYGFRGLVQKKVHFLMSIPGALANLRELLSLGSLDSYPELKKCAKSITSTEIVGVEAESGVLIVEVFSFSYKKGYPDDLSGNGGGFMFDCRAMHNPGRYQRYKLLTGRDREVSDFLEERGEVAHFLQSAWSLTDPAIERYVSRGFSRLQIGFGCTGGQHRSVYCAERTAVHIKDLFPEVKIILIHREHPENNTARL